MSSLTIRNARIWTGEGGRRVRGEIHVEDGRIRRVGEPRGVGGGGDVIDAGGRTVTPGLIDAHLHLSLGGESMTHLDLSEIRSQNAFAEAIGRRHAELPPDRWLIAYGWSSEKWPGGVLPDKTWLAAAGDRPVVCHRADLHATLVNDAVLRRLDTTREVANGQIVRDGDGEPTGLMVEAAAWTLVNPAVPATDAEQKQQALLAVQAHCHRHGLTTVGTMEYHRNLMAAFVPLRDRLTLRCRVTLLDRQWPVDFEVGRRFESDDMLAVIGYKAFVDGTLGSRTARMLAPYCDAPETRGTLVELAADGRLNEWAAGVAAAGLSPSLHAIGDEAVRLALDAIEPIDGRVRPRVEHAQQIDLDDVRVSPVAWRACSRCTKRTTARTSARGSVRPVWPARSRFASSRSQAHAWRSARTGPPCPSRRWRGYGLR